MMKIALISLKNEEIIKKIDKEDIMDVCYLYSRFLNYRKNVHISKWVKRRNDLLELTILNQSFLNEIVISFVPKFFSLIPIFFF